jgi:hypothetical protein
MNARSTLHAPVPSAPLAPGLGISMAAIGRILAASWQRNRNESVRWMVLAGALGGLLSFVAVFVVVGGTLTWHVVIGAALLALLLNWCSVTSCVLEQNDPVAARLVPGHVQHLRLALIAGSLVAIASAVVLGALDSLVAAPIDGRPWPTATPISLLALASWAAIVTAAVGVWVRWQWTAYIALLAPSFLVTGHDFGLLALYRALAAAWASAPVTATMLVVVAQAMVLSSLVQSGGAAHAHRYARRQRQRDRVRKRSAGLTPDLAADDAHRGFAAWKREAYRAWFVRCTTHPSSVMARIFLALGPSAHWTTQVMGIASMVLVMALLFVGAWVLGQRELGLAMVSGMPFGAPMMACIPVMQLWPRFYPTRREQALLVLLPGMPRGAALNRALAWSLTVEFLVAWTLGLVIGVLLERLIGPMGGMTSEMPLVSAFGTLPMVAGLWRRVDRAKVPSPAGILSMLLALGLLVGGAVLARKGLHWPIALIAVIYVVPTVAWCAWRWTRLGRSPTAFPVAR